jgi:Flp pilus assembly protein TadG
MSRRSDTRSTGEARKRRRRVQRPAVCSGSRDRGDAPRLFPRAVRGSEEGSALVTVTVAIVALIAFGIVAIDGVILMTTKTQLQNAADSAALAGASGLAEGSQAVATDRAIRFAGFNSAVEESLSPVVITDADVTFPAAGQVRVETHRTAATGDPLRTYFLRLIDLARPNTADVRAVAVAEARDMCGSDCLKPWAVPDRWDDVNGNGIYDEGEPYDPVTTGYLPPDDIGVPIILKIGNPQQSAEPGHFFPIDLPPLGKGENPETGGDIYREWIATCCPWSVAIGDSLQLEPGNMVGPTIQGIVDLIALDPNAYWDDGLNTVMGSDFGQSPRVIKVPYFDPSIPPSAGRDLVHVSKIGAFFLEGTGPGSQVTARFMRLASPGQPCPPGAGPSFVVGFTLVE